MRRGGYRKGKFFGGLKEFAMKAIRPVSQAFVDWRNVSRRKAGASELRVNPSNNLPEFHWGNHSFTGPNTVVDATFHSRTPFNGVDATSKWHDQAYDGAPAGGRARFAHIQAADKEYLHRIKQHKGAEGYWPARIGIGAKYHFEKLIGRTASRRGRFGCRRAHRAGRRPSRHVRRRR